MEEFTVNQNELSKDNNAIFSTDRKYRYVLWRKWDRSAMSVMFILLHPNSGTETKNSPTINKCMKYAKKLNYGGVIICNLFALVSPNERMLSLLNSDIVGPENDSYIKYFSKFVNTIIVGWGNGINVYNRPEIIRDLVGPLHCLEIDKLGKPKNPLYLSKNLKPIKYKLCH